MRSDHASYNLLHCSARLAVLLLTVTLWVKAAPAVEPGSLSITAEGVAATRAIFNLHPDEKVRNDDHMAMAMVHPDYWHYSILSDDFDAYQTIVKTFRITTSHYVNARTKHIDAILTKAAADGIAQVVNLGAGYDSRAYRFRKAIPQVKFFEIELPEMVLEKKRRLKNVLGKVPDYVTFVPIDFKTQTIPDELKKAGYDPDMKTLFIWEGVTMYIPAEAVDSTLKFVSSQSASGSSVVFDYMPLAIIQGDFSKYKDVRSLTFWVAHKGEPFIFGIAEGTSTSYVEQRGLTVLSDIGPKEMEERYLTRRDGKLDGPCSSGFRIMHASVPAR